MRRFNLLLVGESADTSNKALKCISKVWKQNFLFEVQEFDEAQTLLRKLHIDMILVDLDQTNVDLNEIAARFRNVRVAGVYSASTRLVTPMHSEHHPVFLKDNLSVDFLNYLKALKKGKVVVSKPAFSQSQASFKDFRQLVAANG